MSEDYWRLWILGAPASRGMTRQILLIASRHRSRGAPLRPSVAKPCHMKREGRGGHGTKRGGASVSLFATPVSPKPRNKAGNKKIKEAERRQTLINIRRILRCGARLARRARLSAFHRGSHLRELFHPKGSASGQASWDAVCTGVTRLRLSQSREAPPAPVIVPGD